MTYLEAQQIIDKIDSKTIIDSNWLDYLLEEKELITLQALQIVTEKNWKELLEKYEGQEMSVFQTEPIENYVGKTLVFDNGFKTLIVMQEKEWVFFHNTSKIMSCLDVKTINQLYKII